VIWGNHRLAGGELRAAASAWRADVAWGSPLTPEGAPVTWGSQCNENAGCGETGAGGVWSADSSSEDDNIVWGTECGGADCDNIVWGTACGAAECDNIVWGTSSEGEDENIVWGTNVLEPAEEIVWGIPLRRPRRLPLVTDQGQK
jgi:hypothetical protein